MEEIAQKLEKAREVADIFQLVKDAVKESLGRSRAGLMLGLSPLGWSDQGFVGAYHQVGSNLIVMNSSLLKKISSDSPEQLKYYTFHLLLHEYLHSIGILDEARTRATTWVVSNDVFGATHMVSKIAENFESYLPNLQYADGEFKPPETAEISLVPGFDREGMSYIG